MGQWFSEDELKLIAFFRSMSKPERFKQAMELIVKGKRLLNMEVTADSIDKLIPQCS